MQQSAAKPRRTFQRQAKTEKSPCMSDRYHTNLQYYKFCLYGFLKNLKFFEPFLLLFFVEKGLTFFQIGVLYAVREIATNVLEIPTGVAADSLGRRRTMIWSFIFYLLSFAVFFFTASYLLFIPAMMLFACGEACRTGTHKAMIFEYLQINGWDDQKVHYYGNTRSWAQFGSAVSALLAAAIVFYSGSYAYIFLYSCLPYLLDLLLMLSYPKELDGAKPHFPGAMVKQTILAIIKDFLHSLKDSYSITAITNLSVFSAFHRASKDYLQPILAAFALSLPIFMSCDDRQRSALVIGIAYFIIFILTSLAARRAGRSAGRFDHISAPLNITLAIGFGMGILIGLFYNLQITFLSIVLFVGIYIVQNLRKPMGIAYICDMTKQDILATTLSAESQVTTLFTAIMALFIGLCADHFGIGTALIILSVTLLSFFPLYRAKEKQSAG